MSMRSRLRKKNRSRISLLDRVLESRRKNRISASTETGQLTPHLMSRSKRWFLGQAAIDGLLKPIGIRHLGIALLIWLLTLAIIWGAIQELMSLGAPNNPTQSVIQIEQNTILELLGVMVMGGIGLSLALTPVLKRPSKSSPAQSLATPVEISKD